MFLIKQLNYRKDVGITKEVSIVDGDTTTLVEKKVEDNIIDFFCGKNGWFEDLNDCIPFDTNEEAEEYLNMKIPSSDLHNFSIISI